MKRLTFLCALLSAVALPAAAQPVGGLPRATSVTGGNDSMLVVGCDSVRPTCRTRVISIGQLRKALSAGLFDSVKSTLPIRGPVDSATGAARSQTLTTARTINGVSFNGSANVTVPAAAGTLTGSALAAVVTSSSLTSFGSGALTDSATHAARADTVFGFTRGTIVPVADSAANLGGPTTQRYKKGYYADTVFAAVTKCTVSNCGLSAGGGTAANPTAVIGKTAVNGSATTFMRSDAAPQLDTTVAWGWSSRHRFNSGWVATGRDTIAANSAIVFAGTDTIFGTPRFADSLNIQSIIISNKGVATNVDIGPATGHPTGGDNSFVGQSAGAALTGLSQTDNTLIGSHTLTAASGSGTRMNTVIGSHALSAAGAGADVIGNTVIGFNAAMNTSTSGSIAIGYQACQYINIGNTLCIDNADRSTAAGDTTSAIIYANMNGAVSGHKFYTNALAFFPQITAEGSTLNAACIDGTTHQLFQNAAATCTVSSLRYKRNVRSVSCRQARTILQQLPVSSYVERGNGRRAFGIVAESALVADPRLIGRNANGQVQATNYEEIAALTARVVQCATGLRR